MFSRQTFKQMLNQASCVELRGMPYPEFCGGRWVCSPQVMVTESFTSGFEVYPDGCYRFGKSVTRLNESKFTDKFLEEKPVRWLEDAVPARPQLLDGNLVFVVKFDKLYMLVRTDDHVFGLPEPVVRLFAKRKPISYLVNEDARVAFVKVGDRVAAVVAAVWINGGNDESITS